MNNHVVTDQVGYGTLITPQKPLAWLFKAHSKPSSPGCIPHPDFGDNSFFAFLNTFDAKICISNHYSFIFILKYMEIK